MGGRRGCRVGGRLSPQTGALFGNMMLLTRNTTPNPINLNAMYFSKLQNIFVQIAECICLNCDIQWAIWAAFWGLNAVAVFVHFAKIFVQIAKCICFNCDIRWAMWAAFWGLNTLALFVHFAKNICSNCKTYLSKLQNIFVRTVATLPPSVKGPPLVSLHK